MDVEQSQSLKDVANEALIGLINGVTEAAQFLKGEVPLAVQELLTYYTALYVAVIALCVIGVPLAVWKTPALWQRFRLQQAEYRKPGCYDSGDRYASAAILLYVAAVAMTVTAIAHGLFLLKITLAPRIWLIEYAAGLVK